jgi:hypothetical protein
VYIVGSLNSLASIDKNTHSAISALMPSLRARSARVAQVVRGKGGDAMLLEAIEESG